MLYLSIDSIAHMQFLSQPSQAFIEVCLHSEDDWEATTPPDQFPQ